MARRCAERLVGTFFELLSGLIAGAKEEGSIPNVTDRTLKIFGAVDRDAVFVQQGFARAFHGDAPLETAIGLARISMEGQYLRSYSKRACACSLAGLHIGAALSYSTG